ncbi:Alpha-L-fucosidase precursor [Heterostelium album PN500]|uniref:alpha-L-fucosidase n=1 Tax=Heterostelium pallidum (strain ATCC 26659 / Pp 5 / PN500) TaxID=670386 RepID=D3AWH0_HETP5|nr:Alpha-L-fucosidase precursor [Heterostelium album PN500]EFA86643.1 Alpha-L-fucosidase precursor [Heterostelium album PN500]|eukprot:XP_020438748.1 Alpha-L-fucosidase precursor [Heterostelium album PN500]
MQSIYICDVIDIDEKPFFYILISAGCWFGVEFSTSRINQSVTFFESANQLVILKAIKLLKINNNIFSNTKRKVSLLMNLRSSINSRPLPGWYDDVKFGIFIHWGVYAVPAFGNGSSAEWYWYTINNPGEDGGYAQAYNNKTYGFDHSYQSFAPELTARMFDPDQWADLFVKAGAKYVVLTSKHHEGYTMWPSAASWGWNSVDVGPHMDIVSMVSKSVKSRGLHMGLYHSLFEWYNPLYLADAASGSPPTQDIYVQNVLLPQLYDIVNSYEPEVIWADGAWDQPSSYWKSTEFLSWLYSSSPVKDTVVVNDRWGSECINTDGGFFTGGDRFDPGHLIPHKWENCNTIGNSWGYNEFESAANYQSTQTLLQTLVNTVALGGNLLLDVGPTKEGTIPVVMQDRLLDMGEWLSINGEGIYGSTPWRVQNESTSIWYTYNTTTDAVYVYSFTWPWDGILALESPIVTSKTTVSLLGYANEISFYQAGGEPNGLVIKLPFLTPDEYPPHKVYGFKLTNVK